VEHFSEFESVLLKLADRLKYKPHRTFDDINDALEWLIEEETEIEKIFEEYSEEFGIESYIDIYQELAYL
jgi:hypothetical protein